ncbi:MAG: hypothetical protein BWK76_03115 [Desulfobulbaceae bacterium A2]|nr:MAG: hypothetical protein BWK76_03115 [Desulfobulbaceae bacterium A2]
MVAKPSQILSSALNALPSKACKKTRILLAAGSIGFCLHAFLVPAIIVADENNQRPAESSPTQSSQPTDLTTREVAPEGLTKNVVRSIDVVKSTGQTLIRINADRPPTDYKSNVLEKKGGSPPKLYLDINGIAAAELPKRLDVGGAVATIRIALRKEGLRLVLEASGDSPFPHTLANNDNALEITIPEGDPAADTPLVIPNPPARSPEAAFSIPQKGGQRSVSRDAAISPAMPLAQERGAALRDKFNMTSVDKQRISVDFYKIDLHNVFRLIREVSGSNIVVHEDVKGTLTLAINDVPWDFALDIVLNLKGLHKEERENTIVILPKDKGFSWPEHGTGNLEFEADANLAVQEAIIIQQQQNIPKEQLEARPFIQQGRQAEQREEYETAVELYGKALALWPQNAVLANHMANINLVRLGKNAEALHLARRALALDPSNHTCALNAAIALANMRRMPEAEQYFDQSVSGVKPSREALLSYSVFAEENERYDAAELLLKKHNEVHGPTMESLVALARIQDKKNLPEQATITYRSVLHGGFRLPPDLEQYIQARVVHSPALRSNSAQP